MRSRPRPICLAIVRSYNLLNEVGSFFWYFEVRVRFRRKKFTFAVSSPEEFLFIFAGIPLALTRIVLATSQL